MKKIYLFKNSSESEQSEEGEWEVSIQAKKTDQPQTNDGDRSLKNQESASHFDNNLEPENKFKARIKSSLKMYGNVKNLSKPPNSENQDRPKSVVTFEPRVQIVKARPKDSQE